MRDLCTGLHDIMKESSAASIDEIEVSEKGYGCCYLLYFSKTRSR